MIENDNEAVDVRVRGGESQKCPSICKAFIKILLPILSEAEVPCDKSLRQVTRGTPVAAGTTPVIRSCDHFCSVATHSTHVPPGGRPAQAQGHAKPAGEVAGSHVSSSMA